MATKQAKKATKKVARKVTKKVNKVAKKVNVKATKKVENADLMDSYYKIKDTAKNVNRQVMETASEVANDIMENSEQIQEMATKRVKKTVNVVAEVVTLKNIKKASKSVNDYTLKTAEELVGGALENGAKWQAITNKAIKGSLKLADKQQDLVFDTLETVKGQLISNAGRFIKLFSKN